MSSIVKNIKKMISIQSLPKDLRESIDPDHLELAALLYHSGIAETIKKEKEKKAAAAKAELERIAAEERIVAHQNLIKETLLEVGEYDIADENFEPREKPSISTYKPEVISIADVFPLYGKSGDSRILTPSGIALERKRQAQIIRKDTLEQIYLNIREWDPEKFDKAWDDVFKNFTEAQERINNIAENLNSFFRSTEEAKALLNIRGANSDAIRRAFILSLNSTLTHIDESSNTKIYLQLCAGLLDISRGYAISSTGSTMQHTFFKRGPAALGKDPRYEKKSFQLYTTNSNAADPTVYSSLVRTSTSDMSVDDYIVKSIALLSKEFRVSRELFLNRENLSKIYGLEDTGNPFPTIIGNTGDSIFTTADVVNHENSLVGLGAFKKENGRIVLPLENKYIDSSEEGNKTTYIPGTSYLIDSIFNTNDESFNIKNIGEYADKVSSVVNAGTSILSRILEYDEGRMTTDVQPHILYEHFLTTIKDVASRIDQGYATTITSYAVIQAAIDNQKIKNMLFQYVLLCGVLVAKRNSKNFGFFNYVAEELKTTEALSYVPLVSGKSASLIDSTVSIEDYLDYLGQDLITAVSNTIPIKGYITSPNRSQPSAKLEDLKDHYHTNATTVLKYSNSFIRTNAIYRIVLLIANIHKFACVDDYPYYLNGITTRYNGLRPTEISFHIFETIMALFSKFPLVKPVGTIFRTRISRVKHGDLVVEVIRKKSPQDRHIEAKEIMKIVDEIKENPAKHRSTSGHRLGSIYMSLQKEFEAARNILTAIDTIKNKIVQANDVVKSSFTKQRYREFVELGGTRDLVSIMNKPSQFRLLLNQRENYIYKTRNIPERINDETVDSAIIATYPTANKASILRSYMRQPQFNASSSPEERIKIVSVGIPNGLSERLYERQSIGNLNLFENKKQLDIVKINVYKSDARYPAICFKPKTFIFDLSLFVPEDLLDNIHVEGLKSFDSIMPRLYLRDYDKISISGTNISPTIAGSMNDYSGILTEDEKRELFYNHISSKMLEIYIGMMTSGAYIREDTFTTNLCDVGTQINPEFSKVFKSYLNDVYGENINNDDFMSILERGNLDIESLDVIRNFTLGNPFVMEPEYLINKVLGEKEFDRVFHLPVRVDDFEVDEELTNETQAGRFSLVKSYARDLVEISGDTKRSFEKSNQEDVLFASFFVTMEARI